MTDRRRLSLKEQVDFVDLIVKRCTMRDGVIAGDTTLTLSAEDAQHLKDLADRLFRMAPHEESIRAIVQASR